MHSYFQRCESCAGGAVHQPRPRMIPSAADSRGAGALKRLVRMSTMAQSPHVQRCRLPRPPRSGPV